MKIVFNILRGILALILCFVLFGTLIGGSVGSSVTAFVKEDVVATVFTSMDFNEMFEPGSEAYVELENQGVDPVALTALLNDDAMDELYELWVHDLFSVLDETAIDSSFTKENIEKIVDKNLDAYVPYVSSILQVPEGTEMSLIKDYAREFMMSIAESLPNAEALGLRGPNMTEEDLNTLTAIRMMLSGIWVVPFIVVAVILSGLIALCRYEKFEGFIWLAVVYFITGGMVFGLGNSLNSLPVSSTLDELEMVLMPAMEVFGSKLMVAALAMIGVAVVCLIVFIVGRRLANKKVSSELVVE